MIGEETQISRLDKLILENAEAVPISETRVSAISPVAGAEGEFAGGIAAARAGVPRVVPGGDIAIFADPDLSLTSWAISLLRKDPEKRMYVGARDVLQAFSTLDLADEAAVTERVFIAGYQSEIQLDIFFADAAAGFGGVTAPAKISLALTHMPKALEELRYFAQSIALASDVDLTFIAGGNNKYLTRSQNDVLGEVFTEVYASRGSGKFRCLIAAGLKAKAANGYQIPLTWQKFLNADSPKVDLPAQAPASRSGELFQLAGVGGVFSGAKADHGGEFLLQTALPDLRQQLELKNPTAQLKVLDLGCGNGLVLKNVLHEFPDAFGYGSDISADATCSAHMTLLPEILERRVKIKWDDAARSMPEAEVDAVFLNPPFHQGTAIDATLVQRLIAGALKTLKSGGVLYLVHNSHLRYRPLLEQGDFTEVAQLGRNQKFTVLKAIKS